MNKHLYAYLIALTMATSIDGMEKPLEELPQAPTNFPQTIVCSRLTRQEHQKLATEPEICLMKKNLSDGDIKTLLPLLRNNTSLTKLDLFQNNIGPVGTKLLACLPTLLHLNLEENKAGDEGAAVFETNTTLKILNLSKNGVTDLGVIPLSRNSTLKELWLYGNQITDCGLFSLAANRAVQKLDVRRNPFGNKGTQAIALNQTLQIVFLGKNTAITDEGAKAFINKDNFVHVDLKDTNVSDEAIKLFEQAFPHNGFLIQYRNLIQPRLLLGAPFSQSTSLSSRSSLPLVGDTVCLLSVDGGGICGLIPALILQRLEEKLTRKLAKPIALTQAFEWMAGTSTGGLIALGLNIPSQGDPKLPKYPASQLVKLYKDYGKDIFPKPWCVGLLSATYPVKPLEKLLEQYFGDVYLSQTLGHVLITAFNMGEDTPYLFNSLKAQHNPDKDFLVRYAARATSAAPTYFPAAQVMNRQNKVFSFIDGGVYANNPTVIAIQKIQKLYPNAKKIVVLSLGTGEGLPDWTMNRLDNAGLLGWAPKIASHLMRNAAIVAEETLHAQAKEDPRITCIRIQATLANSETVMDNVSAQNLEALENAAMTTIRSHKKEMKEIVKILAEKLSTTQAGAP